MSIYNVTTQRELDSALSEHGDDINAAIIIRSPRGVWLSIKASGSATVEAWDSATVKASGSATVRAWGSATVRAWDSATVRASDSATVSASDSATVRASDSATVHAYDSATVRAWDSATVSAWDSATVSASDSATVRASDSATVHAYDSATVRATPYVAVHRLSADAHVTGGVVLDVAALDLKNPAVWCEYTGVDISCDEDVDGPLIAQVYKAVRNDWQSAHGGDYTPGSLPDDRENWVKDHRCGNGLHFSPNPTLAKDHDRKATRFLRCGVLLSELDPIDNTKCKAPRVVTPCVQVDIHGKEI